MSAPHLHMHVSAFNARDLETLAGHATASCRCVRDGKLVGEGPEGVRRALLEEFKVNDELIGRVMDVGGEPTLVEFANEGRGPARGTVRFHGASRIEELRIDHGAVVLPPSRPVLPGLQ